MGGLGRSDVLSFYRTKKSRRGVLGLEATMEVLVDFVVDRWDRGEFLDIGSAWS